MNVASRLCERLLSEFERDFDVELELLANLRAARGGGKGYENARRRLENVRLKTTLPIDVSRGLTARVLAYKDVLADHLRAAAEAAIKLELAERELLENERRLEERRRDNEHKVDLGLYAEARRIVNALHRTHGIGEEHYHVLQEDEVAAIARFIQERYQGWLLSSK